MPSYQSLTKPARYTRSMHYLDTTLMRDVLLTTSSLVNWGPLESVLMSDMTLLYKTYIYALNITALHWAIVPIHEEIQ